MLKNPRLIGVKNSSMPVEDIAKFKCEGTRGGRDFVVFNGPDEQLISGFMMGADGGIGGVYGAMPELYLKALEHFKNKNYEDARKVQYEINRIIYKLCSGTGNLYAMIKASLKERVGLDLGGVKAPLTNITAEDEPIVLEAVQMISDAIKQYV